MVELGSDHRLMFHAGGYDALVPGALPIPGTAHMERHAHTIPPTDHNSAVEPDVGATLIEVGLYAGFLSAVTNDAVEVWSALGVFLVDAEADAPTSLSPADQLAVLDRFDRIATLSLENATSHPATDDDRLRAGCAAVAFVANFRNAQQESRERWEGLDNSTG